MGLTSHQPQLVSRRDQNQNSLSLFLLESLYQHLNATTVHVHLQILRPETKSKSSSQIQRPLSFVTSQPRSKEFQLQATRNPANPFLGHTLLPMLICMSPCGSGLCLDLQLSDVRTRQAMIGLCQVQQTQLNLQTVFMVASLF
jgi:hypothetical protein